MIAVLANNHAELALPIQIERWFVESETAMATDRFTHNAAFLDRIPAIDSKISASPNRYAECGYPNVRLSLTSLQLCAPSRSRPQADLAGGKGWQAGATEDLLCLGDQ